DLLAIGEALPIHRLPLQRSKSGWPQALGYFASVVVAFPGNLTVQVRDSSLLGDEQTLMVLEHFDQPLIMLEKFRAQLGPFAWTPPTLWHLMEIKVEEEPAALPLHHVAQLDELGAHPAESSALLFLE